MPSSFPDSHQLLSPCAVLTLACIGFASPAADAQTLLINGETRKGVNLISALI